MFELYTTNGTRRTLFGSYETEEDLLDAIARCLGYNTVQAIEILKNRRTELLPLTHM